MKYYTRYCESSSRSSTRAAHWRSEWGLDKIWRYNWYGKVKWIIWSRSELSKSDPEHCPPFCLNASYLIFTKRLRVVTEKFEFVGGEIWRIPSRKVATSCRAMWANPNAVSRQSEKHLRGCQRAADRQAFQYFCSPVFVATNRISILHPNCDFIFVQFIRSSIFVIRNARPTKPKTNQTNSTQTRNSAEKDTSMASADSLGVNTSARQYPDKLGSLVTTKGIWDTRKISVRLQLPSSSSLTFFFLPFTLSVCTHATVPNLLRWHPLTFFCISYHQVWGVARSVISQLKSGQDLTRVSLPSVFLSYASIDFSQYKEYMQYLNFNFPPQK
jgi:hypothetical protein